MSRIGVRTLADPIESGRPGCRCHALQDAIKVEQTEAPGTFEIPNWDPASQTKVRDGAGRARAIDHAGFHATPSARRDQVDPVRHLIGAAVGWGGNPEKRRPICQRHAPANNDGNTVYRLHVQAMCRSTASGPISVYNAKGYFEPNPSERLFGQQHHRQEKCRRLGRCSVRRLRRHHCRTVSRSRRAGTALVRLYRPRPEILKGKWKFPQLQPVH